jgi:hypothetical protein
MKASRLFTHQKYFHVPTFVTIRWWPLQPANSWFSLQYSVTWMILPYSQHLKHCKLSHVARSQPFRCQGFVSLQNQLHSTTFRGASLKGNQLAFLSLRFLPSCLLLYGEWTPASGGNQKQRSLPDMLLGRWVGRVSNRKYIMMSPSP